MGVEHRAGAPAAPGALEQRLALAMHDPDLLRLALTHRSFAFESGGLPSNERLEFLGDAVLGLVVTAHLFRTLPAAPEGRLAKLRAVAVSTPSLADVARTLGLGELVLLGRGERQSGGADKDSILADTLEAVFGAVYLDLGLERVTQIVLGLFEPVVAELVARGDRARSQDRTAGGGCRRRCGGSPVTSSPSGDPTMPSASVRR